jgi:hypothetical protein
VHPARNSDLSAGNLYLTAYLLITLNSRAFSLRSLQFFSEEVFQACTLMLLQEAQTLIELKQTGYSGQPLRFAAALNDQDEQIAVSVIARSPR